MIRTETLLTAGLLLALQSGQAASSCSGAPATEGVRLPSVCARPVRTCFSESDLTKIESRADEGDLTAIQLMAQASFAADDESGAIAWIRKGAEAGDPLAQQHYALALHEAGGDPEQAAMWARLAASYDTGVPTELLLEILEAGPKKGVPDYRKELLILSLLTSTVPLFSRLLEHLEERGDKRALAIWSTVASRWQETHHPLQPMPKKPLATLSELDSRYVDAVLASMARNGLRRGKLGDYLPDLSPFQSKGMCDRMDKEQR